MATQPEDLTPPPEEQPAETEIDAPPANDEGDPPPSVEEVAKAIGWVPQDQYKGDPAKWRPAHEYIIAGRDIQQRSAAELKEIKQTLDTVVRTSAEIAADRLAQQKAELTARFQAKVDEGDTQGAWQVGQQLAQVDQRLQQQSSPQPTPQDVQAFAQKNAGWFQVNPAATALAIGVSNQYAHLPVPQQLEKAEAEVRRVYPELFGDTQAPAPSYKPQAQTRAPQNRSAAAPAREKGFADLPPAAKKIAEGMVERGVLPSVDLYAKAYWKDTEGAGKNG